MGMFTVEWNYGNVYSSGIMGMFIVEWHYGNVYSRMALWECLQ